MLTMPAIKFTTEVKAGRRCFGAIIIESELSAGLPRLARPARINSPMPTIGIIALPNRSPFAMISINGTDSRTVKQMVPTVPSFLTTYGVNSMNSTIAA